jgi:hypothetical protein
LWILAIGTTLGIAFGSSMLSSHLWFKIAPINYAQPFTQEELDSFSESYDDPDQ